MKLLFMKKDMLILAASLFVLSPIAKAQDNNGVSSAWFIEANANTGVVDQSFKMYDMADFYSMPVNMKTSGLTFNNGSTSGFNGQVGYFFGKERHFGVGLGLMYFSRSGNIQSSVFHVEYKATDFKNDVFRQVITAKEPIVETLEFTSMSIPLVAKFQHRFAKRWGVTVDAGIIYNVQNNYTYTSNASFDYEAIYKFEQSGSSVTAVYDESSMPGDENWLITKAHYESKNPDGNVEAYFNSMAADGYTVALDKKSTQTGEFSYKTGALGFIVQPAVSFMVSNQLALNLGLYYMSQTFKNDKASDYQLVNNEGELSTMLGAVETNKTVSYGGTLGLRFYFGKSGK